MVCQVRREMDQGHELEDHWYFGEKRMNKTNKAMHLSEKENEEMFHRGQMRREFQEEG